LRNIKLKLLYFFIAALCAAFWLLPVPRPEGPLSTVVLDREGRVMKAFLASDDRWRIAYLCDLTVPDKLLAALIVSEDRRFLVHPGVAPPASTSGIKIAIENHKTLIINNIMHPKCTCNRLLQRLADVLYNMTAHEKRAREY
jgi:membrane carboxypeptidase/penicillin-binding protein PbpC